MKFPRWIARLPIPVYRAGLGWLFGHRFVMVEHRGRRTGLMRHVVVEVLRWDAGQRRIIACSGFGERSQWYRNILADPRVRVSIGRRRNVDAVARVLPPEEARGELASYRDRHPFAARALGWMLGIEFDQRPDASPGTPVPIVAFDLER